MIRIYEAPFKQNPTNQIPIKSHGMTDVPHNHMMQPLKADPYFSPCPIDDGDELFPNGIFLFNVSRMLEYLETKPAEVEQAIQVGGMKR